MSDEHGPDSEGVTPTELAGRDMHVHRPKPLHGWREIATEIGVIVVGIVIALGGEQALEGFHWRHEVATEREALRSEVRDNITAAAFRRSEQSCIDTRLSQLAELFRRQVKGAALGLRGHVSRPPIWIATTGSWDIAISGQALGHMPRKEKLAFSDAFDAYKAFARLREQEDAAWGKLVLLDRTDMLAAGDWSRLHEAYGDALAMNSRMQTITAYLLGPATLGEAPGTPKLGPLDTRVGAEFCSPLIER